MIYPSKQISSSDVSRHYNELDFLYRAIWGDHLHHGLWDEALIKKNKSLHRVAVQNLVHKVAKLAGMKAGHLVCDVGCGYGATARMLAEEYQAQVLGVTLSTCQHDYSATLGINPGVEIRLLNWLENDLESHYFDHLISIESSEHMPDKTRFFSEAFRVLKPGGTMVVCAWLSKENPKPWETKFFLEPICREGRLPSLGSVSDYGHFFKLAKFKSVYFEDLTDKVKKTWTLCITGSLKHFIKNPKDIQFLFKSINSNADFLKSLLRIRLAYETKSMRYGIFKAVKI